SRRHFQLTQQPSIGAARSLFRRARPNEHLPVEPNAPFDHRRDVEGIGYIAQRIAFDDDEVGELAGLERPELTLDAERERISGGRDTQDLVRRYARTDEQGHVEMDAEAIRNARRGTAERDETAGTDQPREMLLHRA